MESINHYDGTGRGIRILLYSHDTLGLGHLRRNLKIAAALSSSYPDLAITLATGSSLIRDFQLPKNVSYVEFPPVKKIDAEKYESKNHDFSFKEIQSQRTTIILDTVMKFNPHILLVDHSPLGMKKEILPLLEWLKSNRRHTVILLGLRDIIDSSQRVIELWRRDKVFEVLRNFYNFIYIYGVKEIYDLVNEYNFPEDIKSKTEYLGYIVENYNHSDTTSKETSQDRKKMVLITIGGGEWMGRKIIGNFLEVLKYNIDDIDFESVILAGPNMPDTLWDEFQKTGLNLPARLVKFTADMRPYLERSDLVIATGGYNTVTEILAHNKKAIIIPRAMFREEQTIRAKRFSELNLVTCIHPDSINPDLLLSEIKNILSQDDTGIERGSINRVINLDGTPRLVASIGKIITSLSCNREKS